MNLLTGITQTLVTQSLLSPQPVSKDENRMAFLCSFKNSCLDYKDCVYLCAFENLILGNESYDMKIETNFS